MLTFPAVALIFLLFAFTNRRRFEHTELLMFLLAGTAINCIDIIGHRLFTTDDMAYRALTVVAAVTLFNLGFAVFEPVWHHVARERYTHYLVMSGAVRGADLARMLEGLSSREANRLLRKLVADNAYRTTRVHRDPMTGVKFTRNRMGRRSQLKE